MRKPLVHMWEGYTVRVCLSVTTIYLSYICRSVQRQLNGDVSAVGVAKNTPLESEDEEVVLQLMEKKNIPMNSEKMVTLQPKIKIHGQTISSKCLRRTQKRSNYTIVFTDTTLSNQLIYGRVECFLTCPADSTECIHVAVVEVLQVKCCESLLSYPPEIKCLSSILTNDFVSVVREGPKVAVPVERIVMKCFEISTAAGTFITTLVGQSEVGK